MFKICLIILCFTLFPLSLFSLPSSSGLYQPYLKIKELSNKYPEILKVEKIGNSGEDQPIYLLRLNSIHNKNKKIIYFDAAMHGNEQNSTKALLFFLEEMLKKSNEKSVKEFLAKYELLFIPIANPDGYRKNSRYLTSPNKLDLNRDFPSPAKNKSDSLKSSEAKAIDKLFTSKKISYVFSFHSGNQALFWPYGYKLENTQNEKAYQKISLAFCPYLELHRCSSLAEDYKTQGELIDYAYERHGAISFVFEVSSFQENFLSSSDDELEKRMKKFTKKLIEIF